MTDIKSTESNDVNDGTPDNKLAALIKVVEERAAELSKIDPQNIQEFDRIITALDDASAELAAFISGTPALKKRSASRYDAT